MITEQQFELSMTPFARESPYGPAATVPNVALQQFSVAGRVAATNLLRKAVRRLASGEDEGARRLVERAADLPFDECERVWPGLLVAEQQLFDLLARQADLEADYYDRRWLDEEYDEYVYDEWEVPPVSVVQVALHVLRESGPDHAAVLRPLLIDLATGPDMYGMSPREAGRLLAYAEAVPAGARVRDRPEDAGRDLRVSLVDACVELIDTFREEFEEVDDV